MLKISREVDLGLLLLTDLAKTGETVRLKDWAEKKDLPYRFLSKIAVKLKKSGFLKSKEGREGGYRLARSAKKMFVGEIVEALEGPIVPVRCMRDEECSCEKGCGHKDLMGKMSKVMEDQLGKVSLASLC